MKIYQGEGVPMALSPKEGIEDLSAYDIDVALVADNQRGCCNRLQRQAAVVYWNKIPIIDNVAHFSLTQEQTTDLAPGLYFFEVALYPKNSDHPMKTQTINILEVLPTFIK